MVSKCFCSNLHWKHRMCHEQTFWMLLDLPHYSFRRNLLSVLTISCGTTSFCRHFLSVGSGCCSRNWVKANPCVKTDFVVLEQQREKEKMLRKFKVILNNIFFPSAVSVMRYSASSFGFAVSRDTTEILSTLFFFSKGIFWTWNTAFFLVVNSWKGVQSQ